VKFVYYRSLANCLDFSIEKIDDQSINQLKEKTENYFKSNEKLKCENQSLSMTEVFALIDGLKNTSYVVFHDWIKSDSKLYQILQGNTESLNTQDGVRNNKYKGHALEKQFYSFLTPFLFPLLEKKVTESLDRGDFERLLYYLQHSNFIEESKKIQLQQEVDRQLRKVFSDLVSDPREEPMKGEVSSSKEATEKWNKKSREVELLGSLDLVDALNVLDKQFYALRVNYIDTVKVLMTNPNIEPGLFKILARAISNVELNSSHKSQVESFLQKGKAKVYKRQRTTVFNKALLRNPLTYLSLAVIIILVLLLVPFDFTKPNPHDNEKISGLDSLSQEEVKKTDSLLAFKEDSALFQPDDMNVPVVLPDFILSDNTSEIKNSVALKLYESMLNDYEIQQNNFSTTCDPLEGQDLISFNYHGVEEIDTQFSNHKFVNKSQEDCYILYFENVENGRIYGGFVSSGSSIELKIVKNWRVIFYTGKEFTKFNPLKSSNNGYGNLEDAKKIDKSFNTHFCKMDYSNYRILSKVYNVKPTGETTRLVNDAKGSLEIQSKSIEAMK